MFFFPKLRKLIGSTLIEQDTRNSSGKEEIMSNSRLALVIINHAFDKVISLTWHCGILSEIRSGLMLMFNIFQLMCSLGVIILLLPIIILDAIDLFLYICRLLDYGCKLFHYNRSSLPVGDGKEETSGPTSTKEEIIIDEEIINMLNESSESLIDHITAGLEYDTRSESANKSRRMNLSSTVTFVRQNKNSNERKEDAYYEEEDDDFLSNPNYDKISLIERSFTSRFEVACEQKAA
ncbi:triglyceride-associated lipolysis regulator TLD1 [Saccharomyces paradoxus]|uniref:Triglyceride-associated lipolysis regulator TLD1 n=1 Tax=Saccharomyces paradoxus TaxID=27291 RepID=A0A8B8UPC0_SACPA|nr:Bsc2 [Saccharomyces paradoxus]QHS72469.1 Bsc2 [Saccharomyces paradoxus]